MLLYFFPCHIMLSFDRLRMTINCYLFLTPRAPIRGIQGCLFMKKVYASQDKLMVGHIRNLLENEGLNCITKNEHLTAASGEIPLNECWPEIWVANDSCYEKAKKIVNEALSPKTPAGPQWKCPKCGERHESQFTECWRCGSIRTV